MRATNRAIAASVAAGWSRCGECLQSGTGRVSTGRAIFAARASSCAGVPYSSSAPWMTLRTMFEDRIREIPPRGLRYSSPRCCKPRHHQNGSENGSADPRKNATRAHPGRLLGVRPESASAARRDFEHYAETAAAFLSTCRALVCRVRHQSASRTAVLSLTIQPLASSLARAKGLICPENHASLRLIPVRLFPTEPRISWASRSIVSVHAK